MAYEGSLGMELVRKALHILAGVLVVLGFARGWLDLLSFGLVVLFYAALILFNVRFQPGMLSKLLRMNRADQRVPGIDSLLYACACWLVIAIFDRRIAFAAIMILAFGDAIAHLVSRGFGRIRTPLSQKTFLEGTLAAIIASTLAAMLFVGFWPALVASTVAMLLEAIVLRIGEHRINDNVVIPLAAALALYTISLPL